MSNAATKLIHRLGAFLRELQRRRVYTSVAAYAVIAWLIVQAASLVLEAFEAPSWILQAVIIVSVLGLPIAVVLSWFFDFSMRGFVYTHSAVQDPDEDKRAEAIAEKPAQLVQIAEAERRLLTVLSCNLRLPHAQRDPELLVELIPQFVSLCEKVASLYSGYVGQTVDDGVTIYFGYPKAHEDDARRAVSAGLSILDAVNQIDAQLTAAAKVGVSVGAHSGLVVAKDTMSADGKHEVSIIGEVSKTALWLANIASPNTLIISNATNELTEGYFQCEEPFEDSPGGNSPPVTVRRVMRAIGARSRLEAHGVRKVSPMLGREPELMLLLDRWRNVTKGRGQIVQITGEAGIGKSRLIRALSEKVAEEPNAWLTPLSCSSLHRDVSLYPVVDALENSIMNFSSEDSLETRRKKLEGLLVQFSLPLNEAVPLLGALLSLPIDDYESLDLTPVIQKQRTMDVLLSMLFEKAASQPLLFIVEDLHWADPTTIEFLLKLVDSGPLPPIMAVFTSRPSFSPPWLARSGVLQLSLDRLQATDVGSVVRKVAEGKSIDECLIERIVAKASGIPLFAEELTKAVLELGIGDSHPEQVDVPLPTTLQESLLARLDNLGPAKPVAQLCATLGQKFSYELLAEVAKMDSATLDAALEKLVEAEFVYLQRSQQYTNYFFRHALIRDVAYSSMLTAKRREHHRRIVEVAESKFEKIVNTEPELLAWHCTMADMPDRAVSYGLRAAARSVERYANQEAIQQLNSALKQLQKLAESSQRDGIELKLQGLLGTAQLAHSGYATEGLREAFERALELCERLGDSSRALRMMIGIWQLAVIRADYPRAQQLASRVLEEARKQNDPASQIHAHYAIAFTDYCRGDFVKAWTSYESAIGLFGDRGDFLSASPMGTDSRIHVLAWSAATLWNLGYFEQAVERRQEAIDLARRLGHPYGLVLALVISGWGQHGRLEAEDLMDRALEALKISREKGFVFWERASQFLIGWLQVLGVEVPVGVSAHPREKPLNGVELMRYSLDGFRELGATTTTGFMLARLTQAYTMLERFEDAEWALREGLRVSEKEGEKCFEAEFHRLRGELILRQRTDGRDAALESFRNAFDIARRQGSKALALRAATSLLRETPRQDGSQKQAAESVREILAALPEAGAAPDVSEARELQQSIGESVLSSMKNNALEIP